MDKLIANLAAAWSYVCYKLRVIRMLGRQADFPPLVPPAEKPVLAGLFRDDPATPEGKYLICRRDGTVVEWPSFVLGARDQHAAEALRAYAASAEDDPEMHPGFVQRIYRLADEYDSYRAKHGPGDPGRGRHRIDDPATIAKMREGMSA